MLDLENNSPFNFKAGSLPVLVSFPHNSSIIPASILNAMTSAGQSSADTDWFLDRLYDLPELENAHKLIAGFSRYVVDLNRPADNQSLYPGQTTTGLIPETRFDGEPIYLEAAPGTDEINQRIEQIWRPYHQQLASTLNEIRKQFGFAVLIEAHSIKSHVPMLFEGRLPDFNVGTNHGNSCEHDLQNQIVSVLENQGDYSHVVNGRFIGGYITRHFGKPDAQIHAIQFELSQDTYLDEESAQWHDEKAAQVQQVFRDIMKVITQWQPQQPNQ